MHPDLTLADYVIKLTYDSYFDLDNLKLQNTLLILSAQYFTKYHKTLLKSDFVKSIYGGQIPFIYAEYQHCGGDNIKSLSNHLIGIHENPHYLMFQTADFKQIESTKKKFIDQNLNNIIHYSRVTIVQQLLQNPYLKQLPFKETIDIKVFTKSLLKEPLPCLNLQLACFKPAKN